MTVAVETPRARLASETVVRGYRPDDRDRVLEIVGRVWGEDKRRTHEYLWDWKHARDRGAWSPGHLSHVIERGGRVIGYAGSIPARFMLDGAVIEGSLCLDTLVEPDARGAGTRLLREQIAAATLLLGAGNPRSSALYGRMSGRRRFVLRETRKYARVLDAGAILERRGLPGPLVAAARLAHRGVRALLGRVRPDPPPAGLVLQPVDRFPPEIDDLCLRFARRFRRSLLRDRQYLDWRFADGPVRYRIRLLRDASGRLLGYVVHRPAVINGRPAVLLVEIVAVENLGPAYAAMLAHVEEEARACGAGEIQTLDPGCPALAAEMRRRRFFRRREPHPIIGYLAGPAGEAADFTAEGTWYIGLGDADFEFIFFNQGLSSCVAVSGPAGVRASS